jgi:hypothetical protein
MTDQPDHELAKGGSVNAGAATETALDDHRRSVADRSCMAAALAAILGSVAVASAIALDPEQSPVG